MPLVLFTRKMQHVLSNSLCSFAFAILELPLSQLLHRQQRRSKMVSALSVAVMFNSFRRAELLPCCGAVLLTPIQCLIPPGILWRHALNFDIVLLKRTERSLTNWPFCLIFFLFRPRRKRSMSANWWRILIKPAPKCLRLTISETNIRRLRLSKNN